MQTVLKYKSNNIKIDISKINTFDDLLKKIKEILKISQDKEIDVYALPENNYLKQSNFEDDFLKKKKEIQALSVLDVVGLDEQIKNIGLMNDLVPTNQIIEDDDDGFIDNNESIILNKHQIFRDKCALCKHSINSSKFGCLLCPNYFLCSKCEENHPHPMIKFKSDILSDNIDKIIAIHSSKKEKDFHETVKKKFGVKEIIPLILRTNISSNSFTMGPNQERMLNLVIKNKSKVAIPKNTLTVLIKYQYDLNITIKDEALYKELLPGMEIPISIYITSNQSNLADAYNLKIEVMSDSLNAIAKPIELKVNIKKDDEDDALNLKFKEFPSIILLPKEKKKQLQYIIKEKLSVKTPQQIKAIMEKFKWNIDEAIVDLTN